MTGPGAATTTPGLLQLKLIRLPGAALGRARRGHLGGARPAPALRALQGDGLGRRRPGRQAASRPVDADGPSSAGASCATTSTRECARRATTSERNTFTQSYGSQELDASLLLIPQVGFLPPDDQRVIGTIEAIQRELSTSDGFVLRYPAAGDDDVDGLPGDEGAFLACSFWLADGLAMIGRVDEASELFEKLLSPAQRRGAARRGVGPALRRQVGNFPQAFSHVPLIDTARALS